MSADWNMNCVVDACFAFRSAQEKKRPAGGAEQGQDISVGEMHINRIFTNDQH